MHLRLYYVVRIRKMAAAEQHVEEVVGEEVSW